MLWHMRNKFFIFKFWSDVKKCWGSWNDRTIYTQKEKEERTLIIHGFWENETDENVSS